MVRFAQLTNFAALASIVAAASAVVAQDPPLRTLAKPDIEYADPFSCVSGFRELSDGRVIVADVKEKTVQLIDLRSGTATKIGQEGQGPGEWSTPQALFALPGDTTILLDPQNNRFLTILPNGTVGKSFSVDLGGGARGGMIASRPQGADRQGRLYYVGASVQFVEGAAPTPLDSAPIFRYDRTTGTTDTLTWLQLPKQDIQTGGSAGNMSIRINGPNPLVPQRMWAVAPDGRVAIVHADPYQIEWISTTKSRTKGPTIQYPRRGIAESDKAPTQSPDCSLTISRGGGGGGGAAEVRVATTTMTMGSRNAPARTDWPEFMPPFAAQRFGGARVAPNGDVWVPRSRGANDAPTFDIFDATGKRSGRMALPKGSRLLGFGAGTVYAYRMDEDDLVYLQRFRLDAAR